MVDVVTAVALLVGVSLSLLAAIGLHRFPDVFARMHAATKPATLGLGLVLIAVGVHADDFGDAVKLLLVVALQFLTSPVAAHMVGRAAHRSGRLASPDTVLDELVETGRLQPE